MRTLIRGRKQKLPDEAERARRLVVWSRHASLLRVTVPCGCVMIWSEECWWWTDTTRTCPGIGSEHWSPNGVGRSGDRLDPSFIAAAYGMALRDLRSGW